MYADVVSWFDGVCVMFNLFKKSQAVQTADDKTEQPDANRSVSFNSASSMQLAITQCLQTYTLDNQPILQRIRKAEQHKDSLTLDIQLSSQENAEKIHHELHQLLNPVGIHEINLNVILVKNPTSKAANHQPESSLPKTIDASKTPSSNNKEAVQPSDQSHPNQPNEPDQTVNQSQQASNRQPPKQSQLSPHPRIKHILVVASGKGGVGKSTTAVNLALALQKQQKRVGILDADIYGPSIPAMLGVADKKPELENEQFVPIDAKGLAMLSIGSLLEAEHTPVAWRGPKATGALMQLYGQTNWPNLDYLVIDMPPGTGDIQLTLAQRIPVTGAVIVTTPQHIALLDAQKGIEMFAKTQIPVIGVVENMALHVCSNCGHTEAIFGEGGAEQVTQHYQVPLLGQLPLAKGIREQMDIGCPSVIANDGTGDDFAVHYQDIAKKIEQHIQSFAKVDNQRIF